MRYMLLIHANQQAWAQMDSWTKDDLKNMLNFMSELNAELQQRGEFVDGNGLGGPAHAKIVQARPDGDLVVTDEPFSEAKEFLAGYWVLDVESPERVVEIASRISLTPGPGGSPVNQPVEVHPVMDGPELS